MWTWAEWIADTVLRATGLDPAAGAGAALHFFVYDLLKITVLVAGVAFVMALIRGALPLEKIRRALDRPGGRFFGYPAAALFGALTPFCSCSSVSVFLGFVQARFPIGVAFAFLITSPHVNEIAVALMAAGVFRGGEAAAPGHAALGLLDLRYVHRHHFQARGLQSFSRARFRCRVNYGVGYTKCVRGVRLLGSNRDEAHSRPVTAIDPRIIDQQRVRGDQRDRALQVQAVANGHEHSAVTVRCDRRRKLRDALGIRAAGLSDEEFVTDAEHVAAVERARRLDSHARSP